VGTCIQAYRMMGVATAAGAEAQQKPRKHDNKCRRGSFFRGFSLKKSGAEITLYPIIFSLW
jgi:hypothetical protein